MLASGQANRHSTPMAYIESPKRGRWRVRWYDLDGKQRTSGWIKDKAEALRYQTKVEAEAGAAKVADRNGLLPLAELIERYIQNREGDDRTGERHAANVRATLGRVAESRGWKTCLDITGERAAGLKQGEYRLVKALVRFAAQLGQPADPRVLLMRGPKRTRKPEKPLLKVEEVAALLDRAEETGEGTGAIAHCLATYGHRPESIVKVKVGDVDLAGGFLTLLVKGGDTIRHPILPATLARLAPLCLGREADDPLFISHLRGPAGKDGERPMRPWKSGQELASFWYKHIGGKVTPHDPGIYSIKKFAISSMLSRGLDAETIASITGHREAKTVLLYARTNERQQRAALAIIASLTPTLPLLKSHN